MREVAIQVLQRGGRVSVPVKTLKKLGWNEGDEIRVLEDIEHNQVVIRKEEGVIPST